MGPTCLTTRILTDAANEARGKGATQFGTEHILPGLLRLGNGLSVGVLECLGTDPPEVLAAVEEALG